MTDDANHDADSLNDWWDSKSDSTVPPEFETVVLALYAADSTTPSPETRYASALRSSMLEYSVPVMRPPASALQIVATPAAFAPRHTLYSRTWLAIAAAILIAFVVSGLKWNEDGRPALNVATAESSSVAWTPTPASSATVPATVSVTH